MFLILMNGISGCAPGIKYARYISKDPAFNLKMDYIAGWLYSEQHGGREAYAQVLFYEREKKDNLRRALIAVTVKPASGFDSQPVSALSVLYDILDKRSKFQDAAVISKGERSNLLGVEARTAEITYKTLDKLNVAGVKLIPVKEKIVVLRRGDIVYIVRYENAARDFLSFEKAFNRILKTITVH